MRPAPRPASPASRRTPSPLIGAPSLTVTRGPLASVTLRSGDTLAALDPLAARGEGRVSEWASAVAETHARLVDPAGCRALPREAVSSWGRTAMDTLTALPSWGELRAASALHPSIARDAARDLVGALADAIRLDDVPRDRGGAAQSPEDAQAALDDARAALDDAKAALAAAEASGDARKGQAARDAVGAALDDVETAQTNLVHAQGRRAALADRMREGRDALVRAAQRAARTAGERAEACRALAEAGVGGGGGSFEGIPDDVIEAVRRSPDLAAILRLCGAIREAARSSRVSRALPGREGMIGPSVGGVRDVADLRPLELASLAGGLGDAARRLAVLRLVEGRAATTEKGGGTGERGDVVVLVDRSGSMDGSREVWARALALAIVIEATSTGRRAAVSLFDEHATPALVVRDRADLPAVVRCLSGGSHGGGTSVAAALREAHRALPHLRRGGRGADVLLLTDGEVRDEEITPAAVAFPHGAAFRVALIETARTAPFPRAASTWHARKVRGTDGMGLAVEIAAAVG